MQVNTCVRVFFNNVSGPQKCNFIKKRLQYRFFLLKFANFLITLCFTISSGCFYRFKISCNFVKKEIPAKMFFCKFYKILKIIFWQSTSIRWLLLVFIWEFCELFQNTSFIEHLIWWTSCGISTTTYSKKLFHKCFSSILYKNDK